MSDAALCCAKYLYYYSSYHLQDNIYVVVVSNVFVGDSKW